MNNFIQKANMKFLNFVLKYYDTTDWNIDRKIIHTFAVAEKCFYISCRLKLNNRDRELCYLAGLLHDLGRFEQWKNFHTYKDYDSVDHADLSYSIIQNSNLFNFEEINEDDMEVLLLAVKHHNKEYHGENKKAVLLNVILMSADAYSNIMLLANGSHELFTDKEGYNKNLIENFENLKPIYTYKPNSKLDRILCLMASLYYVRFDFLKEEILNNNIIDIIFETYSKFLSESEIKIYKEIVDKFKRNYQNKAFKNEFNIDTKNKLDKLF